MRIFLCSPDKGAHFMTRPTWPSHDCSSSVYSFPSYSWLPQLTPQLPATRLSYAHRFAPGHCGNTKQTIDMCTVLVERPRTTWKCRSAPRNSDAILGCWVDVIRQATPYCIHERLPSLEPTWLRTEKRTCALYHAVNV